MKNMKSTGIVRKIDELGRVVIPIELRRTLGISEKDGMEIFVDENKNIILKKYYSANVCAVTGEISDKNITVLDGKLTLSPEGIESLIKELQKAYQLA